MTAAYTRREFIAGVSGCIAASVFTRVAAADRDRAALPTLAIVGCFTNIDGRAVGQDGIVVYHIDRTSRQWTRTQALSDIANASYLAIDHANRFLYSTDGNDRDHASAFVIDHSTGSLRLLNRQRTSAEGGLHVAVDPSNRYLLVAHNSGPLSVLAINSDGSLGEVTDVAKWTGTPGPHRTEQTGPHPHHICFDPSGRYLIVPDKGIDVVHVFQLDRERGKLIRVSSGVARAGAAPRHAACHPSKPYVYVLNERDSTMTTYRFDGNTGSLHPEQVIPTTPSTFTGNNTCAEIVIQRSGRFVYASNRGHNSVAIFSVDRSGLLEPQSVRWELTRGETPRFAGLDPSETFFCAANQNSGNIVTFRVDGERGRLTAVGEAAKVSSPVCVVFA